MTDREVYTGISRRGFVMGAIGGCAILGTGLFTLSGCSKQPGTTSSITLPPLPYPEDALEPIISKLTIGYHYGKHHKAYVEKTNQLIKGTSLSGLPLVEIVKQTAGVSDQTAIFNNAAQVLNHDFYWRSLSPKGGNPEGEMAQRITSSFGSYDGFKKEFLNVAVNLFGSGWTWLVADGKQLRIVPTANAENPIVQGLTPLLTVDVWEHAYYLDYQNRRKDYVKGIIDNLLNWQFAASNLSKA